MTKENAELTVMDMSTLPVVGLGANLKELETLAKDSQYLKRIQLYSKGKAIDTGKIIPGNYGIPFDDVITCLGEEIDVIPLVVRDKAIDSSDSDAVIVSYTRTSEAFQQIVEGSEVKNSGCQWGYSFLLFERSTSMYYEYFFGNKTARNEVANVCAFLPKTEEQIQEFTNKHGRPPQRAGACTFKVKYIEKKVQGWGWHAPVTYPCSTPFKGLELTEATEQIEKFMSQKDSIVEKVPESSNTRAH